MIRVLVVDREFGAGAGVIAARVAERLGWKLMDHSITEAIARLAQVQPEVCQQREERVDPLMHRLAKVFWRGSFERSIPLPDHPAFDADQLVRLAQRVVEQAAETGQCVIVGRGAPYFLRERTDTVRVFLYAPREFRFQRLVGEGKSEAEALELVDKVDEERKAFVRHYFDAEWPSRHLYHAFYNTALGDETVIELILRLMDAAPNRKETA